MFCGIVINISFNIFQRRVFDFGTLGIGFWRQMFEIENYHENEAILN